MKYYRKNIRNKNYSSNKITRPFSRRSTALPIVPNKYWIIKKDKIFLIYHPALTYFAADYGMEQISIEDEGKEPNPAHLKKIIDLALEKNIHMIFIQSQFDVNNAESVAKQIGGQIIQIDPLTENWTAEMNRLIDTLDKYLPEK